MMLYSKQPPEPRNQDSGVPIGPGARGMRLDTSRTRRRTGRCAQCLWPRVMNSGDTSVRRCAERYSGKRSQPDVLHATEFAAGTSECQILPCMNDFVLPLASLLGHANALTPKTHYVRSARRWRVHSNLVSYTAIEFAVTVRVSGTTY